MGIDEFEDHYDPESDIADQAARQRQLATELGLAPEELARLRTDALLSCPGCFTTVCGVSAQQHTTYRHQFRALAAQNVTTSTTTPLVDRRTTEPRQFFSVLCAVCGEEVGVQDVADGTFHFFNVIPSEA